MILGCETPRVYTPPAHVEWTLETTHGFAAIAFAEGLGMTLFPWQRWLLLHALELDPDDPRLYRFRTVITLVGRQNGKTLLMEILALWHMYGKGSRTVIGTAQDLANSEKAWAEALEIAQSDEELADLIENVTLAHPKRFNLVRDDDGRAGPEYRVATASRRGGRGFSGDLILLDELREHQSWDSWAAVTKTMMARPRAQAWAFSNAGDVLSVVLRYLRAQAHQELGWPDGDGDRDVLGELDPEMEEFLAGTATDIGFFEWSAPPNARRSDMAGLAQANPSLNHTEIVEDCVTERALLHALRTDPPHVFETECMCRWVSMADAGPFPEGSWAEPLDNKARPVVGGRQMICVDVSWSRSKTYIARAGHDENGVPVAGIAEDRAGTDWVVPWLLENRASFEGIVVQANAAPATSLIDEIQNALVDGNPAELPLVEWKGTDLTSATSVVVDLLDTRRLRHLAHPGLDAAATSAAVKVLSQGAWVINRAKSVTDAAPLQAVIGAVWALETIPSANYDVLQSVW